MFMNLQNTNILMAFLTRYGNKMRLLKTLLHSSFGCDVFLLFTGELESVPSPCMREKLTTWNWHLLYSLLEKNGGHYKHALVQYYGRDHVRFSQGERVDRVQCNTIISFVFYIMLKKAIDFVVELSLFAFCKYNGGLLMNNMEWMVVIGMVDGI